MEHVIRYRCTIGYDGSEFYGFQIQDHYRTVQGELERTLKTLFQRTIRIHGAGRTDRLVHAKKQVIIFDLPFVIDALKVKQLLEYRLPKDICLYTCEEVPLTFHPRKTKHTKTYVYRVAKQDDLFQRKYAYTHPELLTLLQTGKGCYDELYQVCEYFKGTKDFASFVTRKKTAYHTTVRTIYDIRIEEDTKLFSFVFHGNGFMYNQVRNMVAVLLEVFKGEMTVEQACALLDAKERTYQKIASAEGLYLEDILYEAE